MGIKKCIFFILLAVSFGFSPIKIPKNIQKKVNKEIEKTFNLETYSLTPIVIPEDVNTKLSHKIKIDNLFKIVDKDKLIGYAYIAKAPSKTDEFDYLVLLNSDLIITKTKVLIYREDYGGEIGSKRWLKQFTGKSHQDTLQYEKDVVAISGATISALSMTKSVNIFLQDLTILIEHKLM